MTKYLIKDTVHAKENNKNFAGETRVYYMGNHGHIAGVFTQNVNVETEAKCSGYDRLCDAKRAQKSQQKVADHETETGYWSHEPVEIIKVEID